MRQEKKSKILILDQIWICIGTKPAEKKQQPSWYLCLCEGKKSIDYLAMRARLRFNSFPDICSGKFSPTSWKSRRKGKKRTWRRTVDHTFSKQIERGRMTAISTWTETEKRFRIRLLVWLFLRQFILLIFLNLSNLSNSLKFFTFFKMTQTIACFFFNFSRL